MKLFENVEAFLNKNKILFWVLLVILAAAGIWLMYYVTPHGHWPGKMTRWVMWPVRATCSAGWVTAV